MAWRQAAKRLTEGCNVAAICNLVHCPEWPRLRCFGCPMNNMQVAVAPHAAAGPYPTAMRPATAEEADAIMRRVQPDSTSVSIATLREHWLRVMECDHATGQDKPHCACSLVDLGWHPSVGAAVEAWLAHVAGVAAGGKTVDGER